MTAKFCTAAAASPGCEDAAVTSGETTDAPWDPRSAAGRSACCGAYRCFHPAVIPEHAGNYRGLDHRGFSIFLLQECTMLCDVINNAGH